FFSIYPLTLAPRDLPPFPTRRSSDLYRHEQTSPVREPTAVSPSGISALLRISRKQQGVTRTITDRVRRSAEDGSVKGCCEGLARSEEHTSELQSRENLVCRLLLEKKK